jgi:hypothetical protein
MIPRPVRHITRYTIGVLVTSAPRQLEIVKMTMEAALNGVHVR